MIFAIAMGALSIFRGIQQSESQKQMAKVAERNAQYASEVAVNNAEIERQNQSMKNEATFDMQRRRKAIQEASYATSGVLLDGTPSQYLSAQVEADELNMERQDQASYQRQLGILSSGQSQQANLLAQADAYRDSADQSILGGVIGAGTAMMTYGGDSPFSWMGGGDKLSDVTSNPDLLGSADSTMNYTKPKYSSIA